MNVHFMYNTFGLESKHTYMKKIINFNVKQDIVCKLPFVYKTDDLIYSTKTIIYVVHKMIILVYTKQWSTFVYKMTT